MVQIPSLWGTLRIFHERFDALRCNENAHWVIEIQLLSPKRTILPARKVCAANAEVLRRWFLTAGCMQRFYLWGRGGVEGVPTPSDCAQQSPALRMDLAWLCRFLVFLLMSVPLFPDRHLQCGARLRP